MTIETILNKKGYNGGNRGSCTIVVSTMGVSDTTVGCQFQLYVHEKRTLFTENLSCFNLFYVNPYLIL